MAVIHLRVKDDQLTRWKATAEKTGASLAEFVREAVEFRIIDRTSKSIARAVSRDMLPEIEQLFVRFQQAGSGANTFTTGASVVPAWEPAKSFDPQCDQAYVHKVGTVCPDCGGSIT